MRQRIPQSPLDKLAARIESGNTIADAIEAASVNAPIAFRHQSQALAMRIRQCNHPANSWIAPNARANASDQTYDAIGRFWRCGSKLCPDCLARQSRHSRKRLREALNAQKPLKTERYYFSTFTIPNIGLGLTETRSIVNRAWTLFRKRKLCASLIRGGAKSEEFTVTAKGFHYHLHTLWLSRWISYQEVRRNWTECVETAFEEHDRPFECKNKDGLLSVVVKLIIPTERSIQEVCKYVTKSDSWTKVPPSDLIEIAMIRKWNRMFEVFGSFRLVASAESDEAESILDTRLASDGSHRAAASYWRDTVTRQNLDTYADILSEEFYRCVNGRMRQLELRWPDVRVQTYAEILSKRAGP
jgi:Replication protein